MRGASALLLIIGQPHARALSGKLFDYLAAGRPIIGVGPAFADAKSIIERHQLGLWADLQSPEAILDVFSRVARGEINAPTTDRLEPLHARAMASKFADLFNQVCT